MWALPSEATPPLRNARVRSPFETSAESQDSSNEHGPWVNPWRLVAIDSFRALGFQFSGQCACKRQHLRDPGLVLPPDRFEAIRVHGSDVRLLAGIVDEVEQVLTCLIL